MYVITRADLSPAYQAVQASHAVADFIFQHKELANVWHNISNYIIFLSVQDETELYAVPKALRGLNISFTAFTEPDLGNELTAIAIAPGDKAEEYCRQFGLALSERDMLKKESIRRSYKKTRKKLREHRGQDSEIYIPRNDGSNIRQEKLVPGEICNDVQTRGSAVGFVEANQIIR